jgi:hypothetical protein
VGVAWTERIINAQHTNALFMASILLLDIAAGRLKKAQQTIIYTHGVPNHETVIPTRIF